MKSTLALVSIAAALCLTAVRAAEAQDALAASTFAAGATTTRTDSKMAYHGGYVVKGIPNVYFIWYGCWGQDVCNNPGVKPFNDYATMTIVTEFISTLGSTPYFQINSGYPDFTGGAPSGALVYGGAVVDAYSRGATLTQADVADIIIDQILAFAVPQDPDGIYVVLTSADVTLVDGATQFCLTCCNLHGHSTLYGAEFRYVFVGNAARCPGGCATQFPNQGSPNGNYAADAMASWLAHALTRW